MKKDKLKKYKRKYKCPRCNYTSNDKDILRRHKALMHGDYGARERILKTKYERKRREIAEEDKFMRGRMMTRSGIELDIKYIWDENKKEYRIYTDATKFGNDIEIIYDNDTYNYTIKNLKNLKDEYGKGICIGDER